MMSRSRWNTPGSSASPGGLPVGPSVYGVSNGVSKLGRGGGGGGGGGGGSSGKSGIFSFYPMSGEEQLRTVFVGNLPEGIPDEKLINILELINGYQKWYRVTNANNKLLSFGFARFSSQISMKIALEVLPKVSYEIDGKVNYLKVSVESNTLKWLSGVSGVHQGLSNNDLIARMNLFIAKWQKSRMDVTEEETAEDSINDGDIIEFINKSIKGSQSQEFAFSVNESEANVLRKEIVNFRQQSLKIEKERILKNEEFERKKQQELEEKSRRLVKSNESRRDNGILQRLEPNSLMEEFEKYEISDEEKDGDESDLQKEQKRLEKYRSSKEQLFATRQARWLSREKAHLAAVHREKERERKLQSVLESLHEEALKQYQLLAEENKPDYYYGNLKDRIVARRRETERDKRDIEDERREQEALPETAIKPNANKISLSLKANDKGPDDIKEQPQQPLFEEPEQKSSKNSRIELENEIEKNKDNLFNWDIKWESLNETMIEDSLRPLIENNIIEYLGVQEEDLINFVINHIRSHKSAKELISELEMTLDEDAIIFTKKLWRVLVSETEVKYRKIE